MTTLLFSLFALLTAHGEYRIFELEIENLEKGSTRTVVTTLDHLQYGTYYPLNSGEVIRYLDSWMCWDNMSHHKRPCPKPERVLRAPTQVGP